MQLQVLLLSLLWSVWQVQLQAMEVAQMRAWLMQLQVLQVL